MTHNGTDVWPKRQHANFCVDMTTCEDTGSYVDLQSKVPNFLATSATFAGFKNLLL